VTTINKRGIVFRWVTLPIWLSIHQDSYLCLWPNFTCREVIYKIMELHLQVITVDYYRSSYYHIQNGRAEFTVNIYRGLDLPGSWQTNWHVSALHYEIWFG